MNVSSKPGNNPGNNANTQLSTVMPDGFLASVARAYVSRYDDLSEFCFVFPNKRSGTFFLHALADSIGNRTMLAPAVMDIASFMADIAGREPAQRIDMLFRLYKVYCGLLGRVDSLKTEDDLIGFDRFAPWGETLINDFSEVDLYEVESAELFKNVRDYRSISSNFLTDDQLEIIERFFGYRPAANDVERFWKSVGEPQDFTRLKEKFIELWKLLPELYDGLTANLEADGLAMEGTLFRRAARRVEAVGEEAVPYRKVVAVGFNMLSTTEASLFSSLRDLRNADGEPLGEFFWDATGPVLGPETTSRGPAVRAIQRYQRLFPQPEWAAPFMQRARRTEIPGITVAGAPSNVAQTKIAALTLEAWAKEIGFDNVASPRTAIVVPDENLLLPLLHSLPPDLKSVNLTMGYSMRYTAISSFVHHLRRLQGRRRKTGDRIGYLRDDIRLVLAHPLVHLLIGSDTANRLNGEIGRSHMRVVPLDMIAERTPKLADIITPISPDATPQQVVEYLESVFKALDDALKAKAVAEKEKKEETQNSEGETARAELSTVDTKIERNQIAVYRLATSRLLSSILRHDIGMSWYSVFHLIDRLVAGETISFDGRPLAGLQVMGLLETRALDFDRVIILSLNDKVMPRRSRRRTFVPDTLRRGYGLPTASQGEELYSYYFYRLLSRAGNVTLIYDARASDGMRSGGKSRFLMQLEMLHARGAVKEVNYSFRLDSNETKPSSIPKTDKVLDMLSDFTATEQGRNLSASALMNYVGCPVKFYYKNVVRISDDPTDSDSIDPITQGNIVHDAMLSLYFPENKRRKYLAPGERVTLDADYFNTLLEQPWRIEEAVRRAINENHYKLKPESCDRPLRGTVQMVAQRLVSQIKEVIAHDRSLAPVTLVGGEMADNIRYSVDGSTEVNMRYAFDRVDIVNGRMRIIDYKTGKARVAAESEESVFSSDYSSHYLPQLLIYADLLRRKVGDEGKEIELHIYDVNVIGEEGSVRPTIGKGKAAKEIISHTELKQTFDKEMKRIITEIFDPQTPFNPTDDEANCTFCAYRNLCRR